MERFDADPARTLIIGDSEHDPQTAFAAGADAAAVGYGPQSRRRLLEFRPVVLLSKLGVLPDWLAAAGR